MEAFLLLIVLILLVAIISNINSKFKVEYDEQTNLTRSVIGTESLTPARQIDTTYIRTYVCKTYH